MTPNTTPKSTTNIQEEFVPAYEKGLTRIGESEMGIEVETLTQVGDVSDLNERLARWSRDEAKQKIRTFIDNLRDEAERHVSSRLRVVDYEEWIQPKYDRLVKEEISRYNYSFEDLQEVKYEEVGGKIHKQQEEKREEDTTDKEEQKKIEPDETYDEESNKDKSEK